MVLSFVVDTVDLSIFIPRTNGDQGQYYEQRARATNAKIGPVHLSKNEKGVVRLKD